MADYRNLVLCRYNPGHKVRCAILLSHEEKCPDRKNKILKTCPFNPIHKVQPENYDRHKKECPQRPIIDKEAETEMRNYIRQQLNEKKNIVIEETFVASQTLTNIERNDTSNMRWGAEAISENKSDYPKAVKEKKHIVGLAQRKTKKKQEIKKMLEDFEKDWEDRPTEMITTTTEKIDDTYEKCFVQENEKKEKEESIINIENAEKMNIGDCFYGINEYDPNEPEIQIDKQNKNFIQCPEKKKNYDENE